MESKLSRSVATEVVARAAVEGVRVLLIRRPGRNIPVPERRWAYVDARAGQEASWWGSFATDSELLDLRLDGSAGERSRAPIYLVCTHGRHDICCAIRGRPVAAKLAADRPVATWECSHVGGDRFAANLIALPHGLYYGQVTPPAAAEIATAYETGKVVPGLLRGRSPVSRAAQAAEQHARLSLGEHRVDAFRPVREERTDAQRWRVVLERRAGPPVVVVVRAESTAPCSLLTCAAVKFEPVVEYRAESLELSA